MEKLEIHTTDILALIIVIFSYILVPILIIFTIIVFLYMINYFFAFIEYREMINAEYVVALVFVNIFIYYLIKKLLSWLKND